jgi:multisubunit Na+/H+ antiporter MnhB subunit
MPFFFVQRYTKLSQHFVDKYFSIIHTVLTVMLVAQVAGYVLAGILLILLVIYIWTRKRKLRIDRESERGNSLMVK